MRPWQQEKHYVQALALNALSELPLAFKGGTYLWFFHGLKRFSEDLDFTAIAELKDNIPVATSRALALFGVENEVKAVYDNASTLSFRIAAKGPLNTGAKDLCFVYIEISRREALMEKSIPLKLDYPAYQLPIRRLSGMNLDEVAAEKVRAILTRDRARDIYDLHYLVRGKGVRFNSRLANAKLKYYKMRFSAALFANAVSAKRAIYMKELKGIVFDELPDFSEAESALEEWTKA